MQMNGLRSLHPADNLLVLSTNVSHTHLAVLPTRTPGISSCRLTAYALEELRHYMSVIAVHHRRWRGVNVVATVVVVFVVDRYSPLRQRRRHAGLGGFLWENRRFVWDDLIGVKRQPKRLVRAVMIRSVVDALRPFVIRRRCYCAFCNRPAVYIWTQTGSSFKSVELTTSPVVNDIILKLDW